MKLIAIILCLLMLCSCNKDEAPIVQSSLESQAFRALFGEDYLYAECPDESTWYVKQNAAEGYLEVISYDTRKIFRYQLTKEIPIVSCDSIKFQERAYRASDFSEKTDIGFTLYNLCFIFRDGNLILSIGDKNSNITETSTLQLLSTQYAPNVTRVVSGAANLLSVLGITSESPSFYMTTDYNIAYISSDLCCINVNDSVYTIQLKGELPELSFYSFTDSYYTLSEDNMEYEQRFNNLGLDEYDVVIVYGDYYLCLNLDGKSEMLYNREDDMYEWIYII